MHCQVAMWPELCSWAQLQKVVIVYGAAVRNAFPLVEFKLYLEHY